MDLCALQIIIIIIIIIYEKGNLDNTLLILMSDHGARFQNVRKILQGKIEERMP